MSSATTGIIPFTYFRGNNKPVGSSFLRVDSLIKDNADFEKWQHGKKYENLIFQKAYWKEMMELFDGPMILDICDPDWIKNGLDIRKTADLVHAITCSSEKLTQLLAGYFPDKIVACIPDRLDINYYPEPRQIHTGLAKSVVWFGFIHNAHETLNGLAPVLKKYKLDLKIISNSAYTKEDAIIELNPEFYMFDHATAYSIIKTGDIVLNPKSDLAYFKYKSNNKSLISWLLGLPVAETAAELELLIDPNERNRQVKVMREVVKNEFNINQSAVQYREIMELIKSRYF